MLTFIPLYARSLGLASVTSLFLLSLPSSSSSHGRSLDIFLIQRARIISFIRGSSSFFWDSSFCIHFKSHGAAAFRSRAGTWFWGPLTGFSDPCRDHGTALPGRGRHSHLFWALDISVGLAAYLLGLAAAEWGYAMMYGVICPAVLVGAAVLYLVWRRREN